MKPLLFLFLFSCTVVNGQMFPELPEPHPDRMPHYDPFADTSQAGDTIEVTPHWWQVPPFDTIPLEQIDTNEIILCESALSEIHDSVTSILYTLTDEERLYYFRQITVTMGDVLDYQEECYRDSTFAYWEAWKYPRNSTSNIGHIICPFFGGYGHIPDNDCYNRI